MLMCACVRTCFADVLLAVWVQIRNEKNKRVKWIEMCRNAHIVLGLSSGRHWSWYDRLVKDDRPTAGRRQGDSGHRPSQMRVGWKERRRMLAKLLTWQRHGSFLPDWNENMKITKSQRLRAK
jgi:hypothetical protein